MGDQCRPCPESTVLVLLLDSGDILTQIKSTCKYITHGMADLVMSQPTSRPNVNTREYHRGINNQLE
jgi:hypothetical protein